MVDYERIIDDFKKEFEFLDELGFEGFKNFSGRDIVCLTYINKEFNFILTISWELREQLIKSELSRNKQVLYENDFIHLHQKIKILYPEFGTDKIWVEKMNYKPALGNLSKGIRSLFNEVFHNGNLSLIQEIV